jgi:hypothetical protein
MASSSSSGGGHVVPSTDVGATHDILQPDATPYGDLLPFPAEGRLYLDQMSASLYVLTDVVLHKQVELLGSDMALEFGEDGLDAMVISLDPDGVNFALKPVCELFADQVLVNRTSDNRYIRSPSLPAGRQVWNLEVLESSFHSCAVGFPVADGVSTVYGLDVFAMKRRRVAGHNLYWSLQSFYKTFGLTAYKNTASKWAYNKQQVCAVVMEPYIPSEAHLIVGKHGNLHIDKLKELPFRLRCLPNASVIILWAV